MTTRTSCRVGPTMANLRAFSSAIDVSQRAPAKVLPDPRPPSSTQVDQSTSGVS